MAALSGGLVLAAIVCLAAVSLVLIVTDVRTRRIPNRVVLPADLLVIGLLLAAILTGSTEAPRDPGRDTAAAAFETVGAAAALTVLLLVLALVSRGALGGGDVKLAPLAGAALGYFGGWAGAVAGTLVAFALAALAGIALVLGKRRTADIPFAPALLIGCWAVLGVVWFV